MNKKTFRIISFIIYLIAMIALTIIAIPFLNSFKEPAEFKAFIDSFGVWSFLLMFFIQIAQIVVALIPGELIEFISGTLYGCWGGTLFCLSGIAIGQSLIFCAVKFFGKDFIEMAAGSKAMDKLRFLKDEKKLKLIIFFLFFIPGTPKDLLTYIVPLTSIRLRDFLIISLFARIPSVISSTYAGALYIESDFKMLLIVYGIILAVSLAGILCYKLFESHFDKKNS